MIKKLIIILLTILILYFYKINTEKFIALNNDLIPGKSINQNFKKLLKSVNTKNMDYLKLKEFDITSNDMDDYILNNIINEKNQTDEHNDTILEQPIDEGDYPTYNHKLRLLNISKQTKQNYILNILKNKVNFLIGSLENVKNLY